MALDYARLMFSLGHHAPVPRADHGILGSDHARSVLLSIFILILAAVAGALVLMLWLELPGPRPVAVPSDSPMVTNVRDGQIPSARLTFAIAPVVNPRDTFRSWSRFAEYLESKLEMSVDVTQRRTYEEVDEILRSEPVVAALVCSAPYVRLRREGAARMLAVPSVRGSITYHSLIITRANDGARKFEDLRGRSMAFSDPLSNSGRLYPTFRAQKIDARAFFGQTVYTFGHDNSIKSVLHGFTDAAAVDSLVYDAMVEREPGLATQVRIIERSPAFGANPVVAGWKSPPEIMEKLKSALLVMHEDAEGRALLESLGIESFVAGDPRLYDEIDGMLNVVEGEPREMSRGVRR